MNEPAHRIRRYEAQGPQDDQDNCDGFQHGRALLLSA
jgi:hypothetical protein